MQENCKLRRHTRVRSFGKECFATNQPSNWQDADPGLAFVHDYQGSGRQVGIVLFEGRDDYAFQMVRQHILTANLKHAGTRCVRQGQHRAEIKIVRKHNGIIRQPNP
jgi:hypothetical protein